MSRRQWLADWLVVCRGLISSATEATLGLTSRLFNWIASPFRADPEPAAVDSADSEDDEDDEEREAAESADSKESSEEKPTEAKVRRRLANYSLLFRNLILLSYVTLMIGKY